MNDACKQYSEHRSGIARYDWVGEVPEAEEVLKPREGRRPSHGASDRWLAIGLIAGSGPPRAASTPAPLMADWLNGFSQAHVCSEFAGRSEAKRGNARRCTYTKGAPGTLLT